MRKHSFPAMEVQWKSSKEDFRKQEIKTSSLVVTVRKVPTSTFTKKSTSTAKTFPENQINKTFFTTLTNGVPDNPTNEHSYKPKISLFINLLTVLSDYCRMPTIIKESPQQSQPTLSPVLSPTESPVLSPTESRVLSPTHSSPRKKELSDT